MSNATTPSPLLSGAIGRNQRLPQTQGDTSCFQASPTDELALGRRKLITAFRTLPPCSFKPYELLMIPGCRRPIFRLRAGWAYHYRDLSNGRSIIIDVYIPGDVIGLHTLFPTQQLRNVLTLTSAKLEVIPADNRLLDLMADRSTALYVFWLLGQRQRRADRRLAANTRLEPRARLAMMVLDFYVRLRRRRLITGSTFNLPLTQSQIGDYLGLSTVHVSRVWGSLRDDDVVNLEKHCVTIIDLERLTKLADGGEVVARTPISASAVVE